MRKLLITTLVLGLGLLWATGAWALTPPTPQFAFTGFIQEATLDTGFLICTPPVDPATGAPSPRLAGGTMTVNGIKMIVPCNSIVQMSAATFTWADLFDPANSAPVGTYIGALTGAVPANPTALTAPLVSKTGLALADSPMPFPSFAVSATGNVVGKNDGTVPGLPLGTDKYIVAYITPIEQQVLNGGSGIISCIDYANGSFAVGGTPQPAGAPCVLTGGALLQFNDPGFLLADGITREGRWGKAHSIDPRWSGDNENVTIHASTGIPVCIPRVVPPEIDPKCPTTNRPLNGDPRFPVDPFLPTGAPLKNFQMPAPVVLTEQVCDPVTLVCVTQPVIDPATGEPTNTVTPDAYKQVPMMVGDQVNWIGTVYRIDPTLTVTDPVTGALVPDNTPANTYISAHTVEDVLGIFTQPGVPPAYVFIEAFLIGSGGAPVQGILQEASTRLTVVGFTTDPTRLVDIYAQDINPCTGQESLRLLATTDPATQPLVGRFVHRVLGGLFMPPTRYYVMKSRTQFVDPVTLLPLDPQPFVANGILPGQYLLPNFEFVIPENHKLGDPIIPGNFQDFPFLAFGSGPVDGFGTASPIVGQLSPWPGIPTPAPVVCSNFGATPVVNAGPDIAVATGAQVVLTGNVIWDSLSNSTLRTTLWQQVDTGNGAPLVTLTNANQLQASFAAPNAPTTLTFTLTATDNTFAPNPALVGTDTVSITVLGQADIVQITLATWTVQRGPRGAFGKLDVTATTNDPTAILDHLIETYVDPADGLTKTIDHGAGVTSPATPGTFVWRELKGAPEPVSLKVTSTKGGSATVTCGAPNGKGTISCP